ncbi:MAG TPA: M12 family metallo-peptidase [Ignavibacteria bacterium]|nr:M12 family metallo-peptidase [Ignavibacteria bacterium]
MNTNFHIKTFTIVLTIIISLAKSYAHPKVVNDLFHLKDDQSLINNRLQSVLKDGTVFELNTFVLKDLYEKRDYEIEITIPCEFDIPVTFNLSRFDLLSENAELVKRTSAGNENIPWENMTVSYTGSLNRSDDDFVILNFSEEGVNGLISTHNGNYVLGSFNSSDNSNAVVSENKNICVIYKETDLIAEDTRICGTDFPPSESEMEEMRKNILAQLNDSSTPQLRVANIAFEADYSTYTAFGGSTQAITNYATALFSAASALLMKDLNIKLRISYIRIWSIPDPYAGPDLLSVLYQIRDEWVANQGSVHRALVHCISNRSPNIGGGAFYDAVCNNNTAYSFVNIRNQFAQLPAYSRDVFFVAHEVGHNLGPNHTHWCSWVGGPIDTCFAPEGGCYNGPLKPRAGTIMSYCHTNGSISFLLGYGQQPGALIRSNAESRNCFSNSAKNIDVGYPNGMESLRKGYTIQIYWGTSLSSGNVNIEYSTDNGGGWNSIEVNVPVTQRYLNWTIPNVPMTSQAKVRILNSANSSEGDTCDAAFSITNYLNPYNITLGIEGFRDGAAQVPDTVRFEFRNYTAPFAIADSSTVYLSSSGNVSAGFSNSAGGYFLIRVLHRNALETWSSSVVNFTSSGTANYDFTALQNRAYGNNQILKSGKWCFYSGDTDRNGIIDLDDVIAVYNDAANFASGYTVSDITGNETVDLNDILFTFNNSNNFIAKIIP